MAERSLVGKTLGQYELREIVGQGGMSTVYKGHQPMLNRTVAVKILPSHLMSDSGFYERFLREARVMASLEHAHILPVFDYGNEGGAAYIVTRYLDGGTLAEMIKRGPMPLVNTERLLSEVASALDYAHQKGIIHRDIKPANILFDRDGNVFLSDFGLARMFSSDMLGGAALGTPAYMSPEQATASALDSRSDIYSLGVVLFEMITGRLPFEAETPMALLLKHINEPLPSLRSFGKDLPSAIEDVVKKATAKDPGDRYASTGLMAKAFSEAVRQFNAEMQVNSPPPSATRAQPASAPQRGMEVFISYSSQNVNERTELYRALGDVKTVGSVWYDDGLKSYGGQEWWDKILEQVRQCDLFVFVLTPQSLLSFACYLEYTYAHALGKWILPVKCQPFDIPLLPTALKGKQMVNFTSTDRQMQLTQSIGEILKLGTKPLPTRLPNVPPVPFDDFADAAAKLLNNASHLSAYDQQAVFGHLEDLLQAERTREGALILLNIMNDRDDTVGKVSKKIETLLANTNKPGFMSRLRGRWGI